MSDKSHQQSQSGDDELEKIEMGVHWKSVYTSYMHSERRWEKLAFRVQELGEAKWVEKQVPVSDVKDSTAETLVQYEMVSELVHKPAHTDSIFCLALDDERCVSGSKDGSVRVWRRYGRAENQMVLNINMPDTLEHTFESEVKDKVRMKARVYSVDMTSTKLLAGLSDGSILIYNIFNGELLCHLQNEHRQAVSCLKVVKETPLFLDGSAGRSTSSSTTRNSMSFVSASFDGTCRVYELLKSEQPTFEVVDENKENDKKKPAQLKKPDRFFCTRGRFTVKLVNVFREHQGDVYALTLLQKSSTHSLGSKGKRKKRIAHDQVLAASAGADRVVLLWESVGTVQVRKLEGHEDAVSCLASHGKMLVSGGMDKNIRIWDTDSGDCLHVITDCTAKLKHLYLRPDAFNLGFRLIAVNLDKKVNVYTVMRSGVVSKSLKIQEQLHQPMCIAFDQFGLIMGYKNGQLFNYALSSEQD